MVLARDVVGMVLAGATLICKYGTGQRCRNGTGWSYSNM